MAKSKYTEIKSETDKLILSLCGNIGSEINDQTAFTDNKVAELTTALAALIEARVKLDESADNTDMKSKFIEMLKSETTNNDR